MLCNSKYCDQTVSHSNSKYCFYHKCSFESCFYDKNCPLHSCQLCDRTRVTSSTNYCEIHKCKLCNDSSRYCSLHKCIHCDRRPIKHVITLVCNYCKCILQECTRPCSYMSRCAMHIPRCVLCDRYAIYSEKKDRYIACNDHLTIVDNMEQINEQFHYTKFYSLCKLHVLGSGGRITMIPNELEEDSKVSACAEWILSRASPDIFNEIRLYLFCS